MVVLVLIVEVRLNTKVGAVSVILAVIQSVPDWWIVKSGKLSADVAVPAALRKKLTGRVSCTQLLSPVGFWIFMIVLAESIRIALKLRMIALD